MLRENPALLPDPEALCISALPKDDVRPLLGQTWEGYPAHRCLLNAFRMPVLLWRHHGGQESNAHTSLLEAPLATEAQGKNQKKILAYSLVQSTHC